MKRIGVTPGCPAGIGPEVIARALANAPPARYVFFASRATLEEGARRARMRASRLAHVVCAIAEGDDRCAGAWPAVVDDDALAGQRDSLVWACEAAARGELDAIVTGPVRKRALVVEGVSYPGQTEIVERYLGDGKRALMVFAGGRCSSRSGRDGPFVLGLATVHVALKDVAAALSADVVDNAITRLDAAARAILGKKRAHLVVLGVNPHAGEGGMFGREEIDVVTPAIERARQRGVDVRGPVPADGFFADVARKRATNVDAVLAMHHDQGLAPYKLLVKGEGINVTWGVRVPRTSPDHGTADALAGTGKASSASMQAALALAVRIARKSSG